MKTILIVDADPAESRLSDTLARQGYQSLPARDARAALSILGSGALIDLMVSETELSDMDGMDFLVRVRRICPALPVIIVTSVCSVERYLQAVNLNVIEYLTKPLYLKEFSRIVRLALNQSAVGGRGPGPGLTSPEAHREDSAGFSKRSG